MSRKVILILVDGMRADAAKTCGHRFVEEAKKEGYFTFNARTVMPSITLPCHMSLFHSVPPERHGILTNVYVPQARPVKGMFEVFAEQGKTCASIYNWEELRDLGRPGSVQHSFFMNEYHYPDTDRTVTEKAIEYAKRYRPDFLFLYLGVTDTKGHDYGWMTEEYMNAVRGAWDCIEQAAGKLGGEYAILVTADHGGHGRSHGEDVPEDMTIPVFLFGNYRENGEERESGQEPGEEIKNREESAREAWRQPSILDIAPTIAQLLGVRAGTEWEGESLV